MGSNRRNVKCEHIDMEVFKRAQKAGEEINSHEEAEEIE